MMGVPLQVEPLELGMVHLPDSHPRAADGGCVIRAFIIRHPDGVILFDTGVGVGNALIDELYRPETVDIVEALNGAGVDERDVVAIVNSHLHFDHCGQNGLFPSTPVYVQAAELEAARQPRYTVPEWAAITPERQRVLGGDSDIADGVTILATPGHTPGHQSMLIETSSDTSELIVGQACFCCTEFAVGAVSKSEYHDETFGDAYAESLERLRSLDITAGHFSHDRTIHRP